MATRLKYLYNREFYETFLILLRKVVDVDAEKFLGQIFSDTWDGLELKQRMRHTTKVMSHYLSSDFETAANQLEELVSEIEEHHPCKALEYLFLPDYVEVYGQENWKVAMQCLGRITQYTSCEFAIRPFIIKQQDPTMKQMLEWSTHEHHAVRRQASEGCRPRLPWAMALPALKKDPAPLLPILESLKADSSLYVRKSVANNLNDIAKDHPSLVLDLAEGWQGTSLETDWIIKHGCRTLLKAGNIRAMRLFGFGDVKAVQLSNLQIHTPTVIFGKELSFGFELGILQSEPILLRLEYAVYYQKANGSLSPKVYKISEKEYEGNSSQGIQKVQSFKPISTRKFHEGLHQLVIVVNGVEMVRKDFALEM